MAVDFGNCYIRVAVKLNDQIYCLENEDGLRRFPQILALDGDTTYFGEFNSLLEKYSLRIYSSLSSHKAFFNLNKSIKNELKGLNY